jgi:predicted phage replisome organizer
MAEQKKFYWLKLKRDFFKRHDIRIIEEMPNGKDYILFYLKMLIESIDHEGELRFSETIPYNEQMLSVVTNTNVDVVKAAMKIFIDLNMIEILDDSTIFMAEVTKLIGSETAGAKRVRKHREKQKALQCNTNETKCNTEIELEKEKELEKDIELEAEEEKSGADAPDYNDPDDQLQIFKGNILLSENQMGHLLDIMGLEVFDEYIARLQAFIEATGANIKSHYETLLKWYNEDRRVKK